MIEFRDIDYSDRDLVLRHTLHSSTRNCDFNFMNLVSWSFIYGTQIAVHRGLLVVRFRFEHNSQFGSEVTPKVGLTYNFNAN